MDTTDYRSCNLEEIGLAALKMSPSELQQDISKMSGEQLSKVFSVLNADNDPNWKNKIKSAISGLSDPRMLESAGKSINLSQVLQIIDSALIDDPKPDGKLSPILVGMPHELFTQLLINASQDQFAILKQEGVAEPIQHHITILAHELNIVLTELVATFELLEKSIETLDPSRYGQDEIQVLIQAIEQSVTVLNEIVFKTNKALAIAWNTTRADLIEKLSHIKETSQRYLGSVVGIRRSDITEPTGFHARLEERLYSVYGNLKDPNDIEALRDDEPAIEALVKFSVWYLQDYWEIGLLPEIKQQSELDLDKDSHSERERSEYRASLFNRVQNNLNELGLVTVKDLKNARIFSRKTLGDYISKNSSQ